MKSLALVGFFIVVPAAARAYCEDRTSNCPSPPTIGACTPESGCKEKIVTVPPAPQDGSNRFVDGRACIDLSTRLTVVDIGYGIYDNPAGGSWWKYKGLIDMSSQAARRYCVLGANQASFPRKLYIRVWYAIKESPPDTAHAPACPNGTYTDDYGNVYCR